MDKKIKALIALALIAGLFGYAVAQTPSPEVVSARSVICDVLYNIRSLLSYIAAGVAVVIITLQGIKWAASADDPGARKQAKEGIVHAVVGLIIVLLAIWIVMLVFTSGNKCALGTV